MSEQELAKDELGKKDELEVPSLSNVEEVTVERLVDRVEQLRQEPMRFITTTCLDKGDHFDIYYHFDKELELKNLLLKLPKDGSLPSISGVYYCAFLPENEMRDLFGVQVKGLNIDYGGKLLITGTYDTPPMLKEAPKAKEEGA